MLRSAASAFLAVAVLATSASATDFLILGKKLVVKDTKNNSKMVFKSKDDQIDVPDPALGPDQVGASLTLLNPITGVSGTLPLPAAGWKTNRSGTTYRYNDGLAKVLFRNRRQLKVKVKNTIISIRDDSQGTLGFILTVGTDRYCALFDPFSVRRDQPCKFIAKNAAAPVVCPSAGGSPSGAFVAGSTLPARTDAEGLGR
jgi:hypothetical protein